MAEISSKLVMELRRRTGAGMMDCKKALTEVGGDVEKAIDLLREKGLAAAAKKQGRIAAEGLVASHLCEESGVGALVEVNCETDFVAKTDKFQTLVADIAEQVAKCDPADIDALLNQNFWKDESITIDNLVNNATAEIGEKISVRRFARYHAPGGMLDSYIHMGGKVGVLVEAKGDSSEAAKNVIHDCALQIAAASPVAPEYVRRDEVDPAHLEREKDILIAQARNEGKPEKIIEKMVEGRIKKFYQDVCLLEQSFVKDGDMTVQEMIDKNAKSFEVVRFTRFKMGEGLEKRSNDLAAEVAEQTAKMQG
ncbi:MAG: translation elongation factor Ts [Christensenellales bacterium]|jgi:elongation factor Ts